MVVPPGTTSDEVASAACKNRVAAGRRTWARQAASEAALVALAYLAYETVRRLVADHSGHAFVDAAHLIHWEQVLHMSWEMPLQLALLHCTPLIHVFDAVYAFAYWPTLFGSAAYLYVRRRDLYRRLRFALVVSGLVGLTLFAVFPLAPPRLAEPGVRDTIARYDSALHTMARPNLFTNPYAAMPSFHVGWTLLCCVCVATSTRRRSVRALIMSLPVLMAFAVIVTGNHYIADILVGGALGVVGLVVAWAWERFPLGATRAADLAESESGAG